MSLELIIVTPQGEAFVGPVDGVVLPGAAGELGVLERHEKLITLVQCGRVEIECDDGTIARFAIPDGFAEVKDERVVILVDECASPDEANPALRTPKGHDATRGPGTA